MGTDNSNVDGKLGTDKILLDATNCGRYFGVTVHTDFLTETKTVEEKQAKAIINSIDGYVWLWLDGTVQLDVDRLTINELDAISWWLRNKPTCEI